MNENLNRKTKGILKLFLYVLGAIMIIAGIGSIKENEIWFAIFMILFGLSFWPIVYEKLKLDKIKDINVIIPVILFIICVTVSPRGEEQSTQNNISNNIVSEKQENKLEETKINISSLEIKETEIRINKDEQKDIEIMVTSANGANYNDITLCCEDNSIMNFIIDDEKSKDDKFFAKIIPIKEGKTKIYARVGENIKSNEVDVIVENKENLNPTSNNNINENNTTTSGSTTKTSNISKVNTNVTSTKSNVQATNTIKESTVSASSTIDNSKTVYITPTGKRYHLISTCGGKNSKSSTLSYAQSIGLTPCQKCAM